MALWLRSRFVPFSQCQYCKPSICLPANTGDGKDIGYLAGLSQRQQQLLDTTHLPRREIKAHALRSGDADQHNRPVLRRCQFLPNGAEETERCSGKQRRDQHHDKGSCEAGAKRMSVEGGKPVANRHERAVAARLSVIGFQHSRRQHWAERQSND